MLLYLLLQQQHLVYHLNGILFYLMKTAAEYLREYSENCQVIMFTCHGAVRDAAVKAGAAEFDLGEKDERQ